MTNQPDIAAPKHSISTDDTACNIEISNIHGINLNLLQSNKKKHKFRDIHRIGRKKTEDIKYLVEFVHGGVQTKIELKDDVNPIPISLISVKNLSLIAVNVYSSKSGGEKLISPRLLMEDLPVTSGNMSENIFDRRLVLSGEGESQVAIAFTIKRIGKNSPEPGPTMPKPVVPLAGPSAASVDVRVLETARLSVDERPVEKASAAGHVTSAAGQAAETVNIPTEPSITTTSGAAIAEGPTGQDHAEPVSGKTDEQAVPMASMLAIQQAVDAAGSLPQSSTTGARVEGLVGMGSTVVQAVTTVDEYSPWKWNNLTASLKKFVGLVDTIAEIHPYANMAWGILSGVYKLLEDQKIRNDTIRQLASTLEETYKFVEEAEPLRRIESQKDVLVRITKQTVECAYFIQDYVHYSGKCLAFQTLKNLFSDADAKVKLYQENIKLLMKEFRGEAILRTEIIVLHIQDVVEDISAKLDQQDMDRTLENMDYAKEAGFNPDKACLDGTRQAIIGDICDWVNTANNDAPRIFLLTGVAGSGKSSIAHSIAHHFQKLGRLGSSFCFSRDVKGRGPATLFPTISRDLTRLDPRRKAKLAKHLKANPPITSVLQQFQDLFLGTGEGLDYVGPILIVIDALDESGSASERRILMEILSSRLGDIPPYFRILLTSRPEADVEKRFCTKDRQELILLRLDSAPSTDNDITLYIEHELRDISGHFRDNGLPDWHRQLVKKSELLFQWAATACRFLTDEEANFGTTPLERLETVLLTTGPSKFNLDELYIQVLRAVLRGTDQEGLSRFKHVVGMVLAAAEPLSIEFFSELRVQIPIHGEFTSYVQSILRRLASLFSGVHHSSTPIRPLHTSLRDFLTDATRSKDFYIDLSQSHHSLVLGCLSVMTSEDNLHFNMGELPTSHSLNPVIGSDKLGKLLPSHLCYACRMWGYYLQRMKLKKDDAAPQVRSFLTSLKFLYWLEVLSLIGRVSVGIENLFSCLDWNKEAQTDITNFATDAIKFLRIFGPAINTSTPHLYISALPLVPENTAITKQFSSRLHHTARITLGRLKEWPALELELRHHELIVNSVAFSPAGRYVASGSADGTIWICDVTTGEPFCEPLKGHASFVQCIAFSPDGKYIASGSEDNTVRLWNARTGKPVNLPLMCHLNDVQSVAWSPDGQLIASESSDNTIQLWDVSTGQKVGDPFGGHSGQLNPGQVPSVAFSPDGQLIASGSWDNNIRLWNVSSQQQVGAPFEGHSNWVQSVAFSPNGQLIASGSWDNTIRLWDVSNQQQVGPSFEGHSNWVQSVAFSPNGQLIASGSSDSTIRLWGVSSQQQVAPFEGHSYWAHCVAFSPNGQLIASAGGSIDNTIQLWDVKTGQQVGAPFEGHSGWVRSVAFSPDGLLIASGSSDNTIQLWDVSSGQQVGAPFEGHSGWVRSVAFSPDGQLIASGSWDTTIRLWNVSSGQQVGLPFKGHSDQVYSVAFSPDGQLRVIACGSDNKTIRLWDVSSGQQVSAPFELHSGQVNSVAFSPNGQFIAYVSYVSWDAIIQLRDVSSGQQVWASVTSHSGLVCHVAFSPNGQLIASAAVDRTIRLWSVSSGQQVGAPFEGHLDWVYSVAFSPDGNSVVSASSDASIRAWDITPRDVANSSNAGLDCTDTSLRTGGWIEGADGELLLWLPPWMRTKVSIGRLKLVIGPFEKTAIDLNDFAHSNNWTECMKQMFPSTSTQISNIVPK